MLSFPLSLAKMLQCDVSTAESVFCYVNVSKFQRVLDSERFDLHPIESRESNLLVYYYLI